MRITGYDLNISREPLVKPFAFKGGAFTEKWLNIVALHSDSGSRSTGIGGMAILWSDPRVFSAHSEACGNMLMSLLTEKACQILCEMEFESPIEAIRRIVPIVHEDGRLLTGYSSLRKTFALNALVALDNAMWRTAFHEKGWSGFDDGVPDDAASALTAHQTRLVGLPAVTYSFDLTMLEKMAVSGFLLPKIKLGHPGDQDEMFAADVSQLRAIHERLSGAAAEYSSDGRILYYLDANGRYESRDLFWRLFDELDAIGMLEHVVLIEEPFPEEVDLSPGNTPVMIAADESLHDATDVRRRAEMGYDVMTLKPAGKTLSMTFEMVAEAHRLGVPCIVADSACVPMALGWNLNVAARLPSLPGMTMGMLEANGPQHYRNWDRMVSAHPYHSAPWIEPKESLFTLDDQFYRSSAGIFGSLSPYEDMVS